MATWIKAGFWEKLCKPCQGYKGWLNLDELIQSLAPPAPEPAYKVYTALLTQSGGSNYIYISSSPLTIGVTYLIAHNQNNDADFTNVGAPNNDIGTYFVATGTTPNSWGTGTVDLRYDEGAPVVTVLENTIGNIWFTYDYVGTYQMKSDGLFTQNKTFLICTGLVPPLGDPISTLQLSRTSDNSLQLITYNNSFGSQDSALEVDSASIEIRVYN